MFDKSSVGTLEGTRQFVDRSGLFSADFFPNLCFSGGKIRNTIRVSNSYDKIRLNSLSGLILVQTVCKGYEPTALETQGF